MIKPKQGVQTNNSARLVYYCDSLLEISHKIISFNNLLAQYWFNDIPAALLKNNDF